MTNSERAVGVAAKMYDARRTLKSLCPEKYFERCREWQDVIKKIAADNNWSELETVIDILGRLKHESGMSVLWVLAAYVEMVEPSGEKLT